MTFKEHFNKCWPNEGVGYVKNGEFFPLENIADDPLRTFHVDSSFLLNEPDVLLHSHCRGVEVETSDPHSPSYEDLLGQINTGIEWGICVTDGVICEDPIYWGNPKNRPPLLGREFIYNAQDCFTLVQDYFFQERGVALPNLPRTPHWNEEGENYIARLHESWGFVQVPLAEALPGDVLVYQVLSQVPNHLGIYLGNNEVLSHWTRRVSCIESMGKWASHIVMCVRYAQ
jgi:hypothetical protein